MKSFLVIAVIVLVIVIITRILPLATAINEVACIDILEEAGYFVYAADGEDLDLQFVYARSSDPELRLSSPVGGLSVRDTMLGLGTTLLEVENYSGQVTYLDVCSSNISAGVTICPTVDGGVGLGDQDCRWSEIFMGSGKFYIGDSSISENATDNTLVIAANVTELRSTKVGIGTSSPEAMLDVRGSVIAKEGFGVKLWDVNGQHWEIATTEVEYYGPNQHGGIYGTIYRSYFAASLPSYLTSGDSVSAIIDYTLMFTIYGRHITRGVLHDKGDPNEEAKIVLTGASGKSNLAFLTQNITIDRGWVDYTK